MSSIAMFPMCPGKQESKLTLKINGGVTSRTVALQGTSPEGLVRWKAQKLALGCVPVGLPVTASVLVVNKGMQESAVRVISSPHLECEPKKSLIAGGDSVPIELSFTPREVGEFKSKIVLEQRGGKLCSLPVTAEAVMPHFSILEKEFNFGVVYFGANRKLAMTVVNSGPVQAQVVFDFSTQPMFSLSLSGDQWDSSEYPQCPLQEEWPSNTTIADDPGVGRSAIQVVFYAPRACSSMLLALEPLLHAMQERRAYLWTCLPSGHESWKILHTGLCCHCFESVFRSICTPILTSLRRRYPNDHTARSARDGGLSRNSTEHLASLLEL
jgi:hypothetical protein